MLIIVAADTFYQLNLPFIADSSNDFCSGLLWKLELNLKPVLTPGLLSFITYFNGSKLYLCFTFCIIIYSFLCQFCLHYYWYCYNQKQSPSVVMQKKCSYKFRKTHKKTPVLESCFQWSCRSTEFDFAKKKRFQQRCFFALRKY